MTTRPRLTWWIALLLLAGLVAGCASAARDEAPSSKRGGPLHHYQLGRMYFEQGRTADALREIDHSIKLDGSLPQVWFYRGYIYFSLSEWSKAESDFRAALQRNAYYTDARMWLAAVLDKEGRVPEALAELDKAEQDRSFANPEKILLTKAKILRRQNRQEEALEALREAVSIRPRSYDAHFEMALVLVQLGRLDEAARAFAAAEPGYARDAQFHYEYGEALFRMRRRADAARELRRAIDLAPGTEAAEKSARILKEIE